jgi:hypothetical protein
MLKKIISLCLVLVLTIVMSSSLAFAAEVTQENQSYLQSDNSYMPKQAIGMFYYNSYSTLNSGFGTVAIPPHYTINLALRGSPSLSAPLNGARLPNGTELNIHGTHRAEGILWLHVRVISDNRVGWVDSKYVL